MPIWNIADLPIASAVTDLPPPPAAEEDAPVDGGRFSLDDVPPRAWVVAWLISLGAAALLLLLGDPARTPWAAIGALLLGAVAVVGGLIAARGYGFAPPAPRLTSNPHAMPPPLTSGEGEARIELERFQALMGDLPELGLMMDRDGRAEVVFGRSIGGVSADALHAGLPALAAESDRAALTRALSQAWSGGDAQASFALAGSPGRRLHLSARKTGDGALAAILTTASDPPPAQTSAASTPVAAAAGELSSARAAVQSAQDERDAAVAESANKSRFLANMSHELRTPLNAILGFSDIMKTKLFGPLPERYAEYAELIHESGRHLTDLINDVLDMSKIEADRYVLHREAFDAREPVGSAMKLLTLQAEDKGVSLRGDLPAEAVQVDADRRALKQIVINLVANAIKFTPPEGRVDVTLRAQGGALELVVADTGEGISPEDLQRLGQPYAQTDAGRRAQGTGLGLSLVKALTALHGGEFLLESRLGEGSAATVRLPVLVESEKPRTGLL